MNPDVRTAGVIGTNRANSTHGGALGLLLSLVVFATAACGDSVAPAASANLGEQTGLPALGPTSHTAHSNVSQVAASPPAAELSEGVDETVRHHVADASGDKTHAVFLHGLHSPFGLVLAMSRIPPPR
jgi:hypothetical protein